MDRIGQTFNRNYILENFAINCKTFQKNGNWNVYRGNSFSTPNISAPAGTPFNRREWIKTVPDVPSLRDVGVMRQ
jgi:hypothetical protein